MTDDNRSADRQDLDAMTREFLAKGGKIVQCAPGSSDNVVYRKGTFRRRPAGDGKTGTPGAPGVQAGAQAGAQPDVQAGPANSESPPPLAVGSDSAAD